MTGAYTIPRWKTQESEEATADNEQRFQTLYAATARPILAYLLAVTRRKDVAEDLTQETFCRFLVRQPPEMSAEETRRYLFRIATNLLRDRWRCNQDLQPLENFDQGCSQEVDTQLDVHRAMQALKPRERELLWLAYVEGMTHSEIAQTMQLNSMSIRLLLFRARRKAAALLRPEGDTV